MFNENGTTDHAFCLLLVILVRLYGIWLLDSGALNQISIKLSFNPYFFLVERVGSIESHTVRILVVREVEMET